MHEEFQNVCSYVSNIFKLCQLFLFVKGNSIVLCRKLYIVVLFLCTTIPDIMLCFILKIVTLFLCDKFKEECFHISYDGLN